MTSNLTQISKIRVIDDTDSGRDALGLVVEDANFTLEEQSSSIYNLDLYLQECKENVDAIVSDHHLRRQSNYFPVDGAEFVSRCYQTRIPSLLVTKFESVEVAEFRRYRKYIPVILKPAEYNEDTLIAALEKSINEFKGNFESDRKSWRTLIRIEDVDPNNPQNFYAIVPAWNSREAIALNLELLPPEFSNLVKPEARFYAQVNIGTEKGNELFFSNWEL